MRILALETSTEWCSVAVGDGTHWQRRDERVGHAHSERLLPMVDAALVDAGWALRDLEGIAFGAGPGSFTGIRIGCGVAQGLAFAGNLPVVPIPTLAALAQQVFRDQGWPCVVACLDARMHEVYVAAYARDAERWREVAAPAVVAPGELALCLPNASGKWAGAGGGFAVYPALASQLALTKVAPDAHPTAQAIGELALAPLAAGEGVAAADALPIYVRHRVALTTAEREAGLRL
ncbi:MAG: tRNA (adenosine(37)-N6)-threonylcarbamoyltransferase complex dimerization subunit type 1 TsaB [Betaproteobacteria bacterium]